MKKITLILLLFIGFQAYSQEYKDNISICQFSSSFTSDADLDLRVFKDNFFYNFKIEKDRKIFDWTGNRTRTSPIRGRVLNHLHHPVIDDLVEIFLSFRFF